VAPVPLFAVPIAVGRRVVEAQPVAGHNFGELL